MKKKTRKQLLAFALALIMAVSVLPAAAFAANEDASAMDDPGISPYFAEPGDPSESFEPWVHGYRYVDLLTYDPATDPYAEEMRASIPKQDRNNTFAATQANPWLTDRSQLYVMSASNYRNTGDDIYNGNASYDDFTYNPFMYWQYANITGTGGRPTAGMYRGVDTGKAPDDGRSLGVEYSPVAIPMAAATNVAHRNGVMSLGEFFIDATWRGGQFIEEFIYKDENGSYPYAQKMIDIMNDYGFDGYFINVEADFDAGYVETFREILAWMRTQGAYIQWYDSIDDSGSVSYQNAFNEYNQKWVKNGDTTVSDAIFMNYGYDNDTPNTTEPDAIQQAHEKAVELRLDPYKTVFMGVEGDLWRFSMDFDSKDKLQWNDGNFNSGFPYAVYTDGEHEQPWTSFAVWSSDFYQKDYHGDNNDRYEEVGYQWEAEERARMYYNSRTENAGDYEAVVRDDINFDLSSDKYQGSLQQPVFKGFSKYVVEKSVINGSVFASDFSNGHGMQYWRNGQVSRDMQWTNYGLQDILPTWQWWVTREAVGDSAALGAGESLLELDWDYGPKFYRLNNKTGARDPFSYQQIGAYNGGSSLAVYGDLNGSQVVNLYKTELDVTAGSKLKLTYNKPSVTDDSQMYAVLSLVNGSGVDKVYLPIAGSNAQTTGWKTAELDLSAYSGRTIAAIGVGFTAGSAVSGYQVNLGRLEVTDGRNYTPATPTGLHLVRRFDYTGEIEIAWNQAAFGDVQNYYVFAQYDDGSQRFVGGGFAGHYYIKNLEDAAHVTGLYLYAVGRDGSLSAPAYLELADAGEQLSNVRTNTGSNELTVYWQDASGVYNTDDVTVELSWWGATGNAPVASQTVRAGEQTATFNIPQEDGSSYILTLTATRGGVELEPVSYFGMITDTYSAPYDGEARKMPTSSGANDGLYLLTTPTASDWKAMLVETSAGTERYARFSEVHNEWGAFMGVRAKYIPIKTTGSDFMTVRVEDIYGNVSEPVTFLFQNGRPATGSLGSDMFPDAALAAAVAAQVGTTYDQLSAFTGTLNLSGTAVADLTGINYLGNMTGLNLTNCTSLTTVDMTQLPNTKVSVAGCSSLENLYMPGAKQTSLDIRGVNRLHNFDISNSQIDTLTADDASAYTNAFMWNWQGARMDLSSDTPEGRLKDGIAQYFADNDTLRPEVSGEERVLLNGENWIDTTVSSSSVSKIFDLGADTLLSRITFVNTYHDDYSYYDYFSLTGASVSVSLDGIHYEKVYRLDESAQNNDGGYSYNVSMPLPDNVYARYVKVDDCYSGYDNNYGGFYTSGWMFYGKSAAIPGITYDNQQPAITMDSNVPTLSVVQDGRTYQLLELLADNYGMAATKSGKHPSELIGADWVDQSYLTPYAKPESMQVVITKPDGSSYAYPGSNMGEISADPVSVTNILAKAEVGDAESAGKAFDGDTSTKWCDNATELRSWLGFELAQPAVIGQWYTLHGGSEGAGYVTSAFRLQALDASQADRYLAADETGKREILDDDSCWNDLDVVTRNAQNEVNRLLPANNLVPASIYRYVVDDGDQPGFTPQWGYAVRLFEMELYVYDGDPNSENTNGKFRADEAGTYLVKYIRPGDIANNVVATTFVTVQGGPPPCLHEHVVHEERVEPTCFTEGYIESWYCQDCERLFADAGFTQEIMAPDTILPNTGHHGIYHIPNESTETEAGNREYWWCAGCHKYFSDEECETEIDQADTVIPATGHEIVHVVRVEPTETENGNIEYWTCSKCGKFYTNEACTDEIREADTILFATSDPKATCTHNGETTEERWEATCTQDGQILTICVICGKTVGKVPIHMGHNGVAAGAVEPTCTEPGRIEHWDCENCGKHFSDAECTRVIADDAWLLPALGHNPIHHERVEPTAAEAGNIEYWRCNRCGKYFSDAECTAEIPYEDTILPALGHYHTPEHHPAVEPTYASAGNREYWRCLNCGKLFLDAACTMETDLAGVTLDQLQRPVDPWVPPVDPWVPSEPSKPSKPAEPAEPSEPSEPSEPGRLSGDTYATVDVETEGTTSSMTLDGSAADAIIAEAVERDSENIILTVDTPAHATEVVVSIPASTMSDLTGKTDANLTVKSPIADVTIAKAGLASLGSGVGAVEISAKAAGDTVQITVSKDSQPVSSIPGGLDVSIPAAGATPGTVAILVDENGKETILKKAVAQDGTMDLTLAGSATIKIVDNSKNFADTQNHWANDAIDFVASRELFQGTGPDTFSADAPMNRAMLVTVLHRLEDQPAGSGGTFADVEPGAYYADAVSWATGLSIVGGNGTGFNPNGQVTREELATFLYRYAKAIGANVGASGSLSDFSDHGKVSDWASEAMQWTVGAGIIVGSNGRLNPSSPATRAEVATILMRFCQKIAQ